MGIPVPDLGAQTAAQLAELRHLFRKADEFYRYYREALLNEKWHHDQPRPMEWIPLSDH
jgi:hypothetical protein